MTPQLAKQSLEALTSEKSGFFRDAAVNMQGVATVLALRSKYSGKTLTDPAKYVDPSYRNKALGN